MNYTPGGLTEDVLGRFGMWDVRNRITGVVLTFTADSRRAEEIASGFEQLDVLWDRAASDYYWAAPRPRLGQLHRIDADARAELRAEVDRLMAAYLEERAA